MVTACDILVIGAGIAGLSAAARLAPEAGVIVLEREAAPSMHSTGRSAALFIRNYGNATLRALNGLGIGRNDRVAIVLANGPEMATCFMACACGVAAGGR